MNSEVFCRDGIMLTVVSNGCAVTDIVRGELTDVGDPDYVTHCAAEELNAYFDGKLREFSTPLEFNSPASEFRYRVWSALREIPFGETVSYSEFAKRIGSPGASRAVGNAVGANPILVMVPCHRVVASGGIGGFSAGLDLKRELLRIEGSYGRI